jgi:hypothetical protein
MAGDRAVREVICHATVLAALLLDANRWDELNDLGQPTTRRTRGSRRDNGSIPAISQIESAPPRERRGGELHIENNGTVVSTPEPEDDERARIIKDRQDDGHARELRTVGFGARGQAHLAQDLRGILVLRHVFETEVVKTSDIQKIQGKSPVHTAIHGVVHGIWNGTHGLPTNRPDTCVGRESGKK